ncbi:hypothetical protein [Sporosarcina sp. ACRSM]|nr:hypothetical protein [Sporosarcina sp. ACRSM]
MPKSSIDQMASQVSLTPISGFLLAYHAKDQQLFFFKVLYQEVDLY